VLFTVSATFSDFAVAYEQYEVDRPVDALAAFLASAESLKDFNREARASAALTAGHRLTPVAGGMRGLWIWHLTVQIEHEELALYGGCIVQTDPTGPAHASISA